MHPALHIRNIEKLPVTVRTAAVRAVAHDSSLDDLKRIRELVDIVPTEQKILLLPVFFMHLNPAAIPSLDHMDMQSAADKKALEFGMLSVDGLHRIRTRPQNIGPDLWSHAWPWFIFLLTHWDNLPFRVCGEVTYCTEFLFFAGSLHDHAATRKVMLAAPGFRVMVGRALSFLPRLTMLPVGLFEMVLNDLCGFLNDEAVETVEHLDDLILGAGGSIQDLGRAAVRYLEHAYRREETMSMTNSNFIHGIICFIAAADTTSFAPDEIGELTDDFFPPAGAFCRSLIPEGIIQVIMDTMTFLTTSSDVDRGVAFNSCFALLTRYMMAPSGPRFVEEALCGNLLSIMTTCATLDCVADFEGSMFWILNKVLHRDLVHYRVVAQLHKIQVADDVWESLSEDPEWDAFFGDMYLRFDVLDDSKTLPRLKACDNDQCGKIAQEREFRRCTCNSLYYCSRDCQKVDWTRNDHKALCRRAPSLALAEYPRTNLPVRERIFFRTLLHSDYKHEITLVYEEQVKFLAANPALRLHVRPRGDHKWRDAAARAWRSGGRIALHVMKVPEGSKARFCVVPLRRSHGGVEGRMRKLAAGLPKKYSDDSLKKRVKAILKDYKDVVEIH
ncbi:hypothetical protein C8R46DRAFT_1346951 [Mycena filopes]|nr:hypothetical protein C8R46DRAFT_1346951 [Mycena filopes]